MSSAPAYAKCLEKTYRSSLLERSSHVRMEKRDIQTCSVTCSLPPCMLLSAFDMKADTTPGLLVTISKGTTPNASENGYPKYGTNKQKYH